MKKIWKRIGICLLAVAVLSAFAVLRDREYLNRELIRLHVVANSDSEEDQALKLQVRDAVLESLNEDLANVGDVEAAKAYLRENLPKLQSVANRTLEKAGVDSRAVVSLCRETYDIRRYDTFSLPSGVYESLRIVIGEGAGHNWWCVAFPTLCLSATTEGFEEAAETAGMGGSLTRTLSNGEDCSVRFFLLDVLGKAENLCFQK